MIRIVTAIGLVLLPTAALAQQTRETFKDANGRTLGRSVTDSRGNTTFYDSMGRNAGRSSNNGASTTTFYDASGRRVGTTRQTGR